MRRLAPILAALWAGSLWTICGVVAPTLFASLNDRRLAGELAGQFFRIEAWLGIGLATALVASIIVRKRHGGARRGIFLLIAMTAGAPLISELALRPLMEVARETGDMARFGMLHGVSAAFFAFACLGALALAWRLNRPAE